MSCECYRLHFILQSCRDILSLVFQIFHTIPTTPDAALSDRTQACVKVLIVYCKLFAIEQPVLTSLQLIMNSLVFVQEIFVLFPLPIETVKDFQSKYQKFIKINR